jgi:photosystem II stability/assembly factor-like uncharacterized protein
MASSDQIYLAGETALWFQKQCGDPWEFLGCHNLTGITVPRGETNPVYCRTGKNQYTIKRTWKSTPGLGGLTVVAYDSVLNVLQEIGCAFNLIVLHSSSGSDDDPTNWDYGYYYNGVELTSEDTDTHVLGMSPDDQTTVMLSMPGSFRQRVKFKQLEDVTIDASAISENDFNAVSFCDDPSCDNFGNLQTIGCQTGYVATKGPTAKIIKITEGGTLTAISTPFTNANHPIADVKCDGDVVIAINGSASEYAYSWDAGVTWGVVTSPTSLINKIYILSPTKIWFVGQTGYIGYSSNRGATVSTQSSNTTQSLNDVSAADSLTLYAVGDNNTLLKTIDGGTIWSALTGPAAAVFPNDLYRVLAVPGTDIVFVGDESGNLYRSRDGGETWETVFNSVEATAGGIRGLVAPDCNIIAFAANDDDPYFYSGQAEGVVYQSLDGGNSFAPIEVPDNTGFLDLFACDVNRYWLAGVDGMLAKLSGPTITV